MIHGKSSDYLKCAVVISDPSCLSRHKEFNERWITSRQSNFAENYSLSILFSSSRAVLLHQNIMICF